MAFNPPISSGTSWRTAPARPLSRSEIKELKRFAGISRISRVDGLTGIDIPVYSVTRPQSKIAISVHAGKGTTAEESFHSGLFEAVEIAAAESYPVERSATVSEMQALRESYIDPSQLACASLSSEALGWTRLALYPSGEAVWCPSVAVGMLKGPGPFSPTSNGLASGSTFEDALLHALLEVLERHALSLALVRRQATSVNLSSVQDAFLESLRRKLAAWDLLLEVKDISWPIGIPCYYALIRSESERDTHLISGGMGCHLDPLLALRRALTEAFQSRAIAIAGAREDLSDLGRLKGPAFDENFELFRYWYEPTETSVDLPPGISSPLAMEDAIKRTLETARATAPELGRLAVTRFPAPQGVVVVRAVLEGAELFALDRTRIGKQIAQIFEDAGV